MNFSWQWLVILVDRHRIIYGVAGALVIAMIMTAVSMALYVSSGASRLDLSRPGYEAARGDVQRAADEEAFNASGPMDTEVLKDFQSRFTKHREMLNKLDTYGTNALDDAELQIAPGSSQ